MPQAEITNWKAKFGIAKAKGRAYVDGKLAMEVKEMTFVSRRAAFGRPHSSIRH
jgi:hypothetical protein